MPKKGLMSVIPKGATQAKMGLMSVITKGPPQV